MILTKKEILKYIKRGKVKITPFSESQIGPASIDLTLGNEFRIFRKSNKKVNIVEKVDAQSLTKLITVKDYLDLKPGKLVLGITKEKITLPENIVGWLQGRSRFARTGLMVHITASFLQPGINNKQVLEIYNASPFTLRLYPNTKICQMILSKTKGKEKYKGIFENQINP